MREQMGRRAGVGKATQSYRNFLKTVQGIKIFLSLRFFKISKNYLYSKKNRMFQSILLFYWALGESESHRVK